MALPTTTRPAAPRTRTPYQGVVNGWGWIGWLVLLLSGPLAGFAQAPTLLWQKALGGSQDDGGYGVTATSDGGFVVAGYTSSTDGDVTGSHGDYENWVVRLGAPAPTLTSLAVSPSPVCAGQPIRFTATVGNLSGAYNYSLTNGVGSQTSGSFTGADFSLSLTASGSGPQSFTLTVSGASGRATSTVPLTVNALPSLTLTASAQITNQPISVTATGCPGGTINWTSQGGSGQATANIYTFTQPGSYTLSATCTLNACTSAPSSPLVVQVLPAGFAITSVSMVGCQLTNATSGEYQVSFTPLYNAANTNPISFSVVNELNPTSAPGPYSLRLYSDNPAITLVANQAGNPEARYRFAWLQACASGTSPNRPPTTSGIPNQTLVQNQPYQLQLTNYVTDPDGQPLSFQVTGLPPELSLSGSLISGKPTQTGVSTVNVTALDPGGLSVSTSFQL